MQTGKLHAPNSLPFKKFVMENVYQMFSGSNDGLPDSLKPRLLHGSQQLFKSVSSVSCTLDPSGERCNSAPHTPC